MTIQEIKKDQLFVNPLNLWVKSQMADTISKLELGV